MAVNADNTRRKLSSGSRLVVGIVIFGLTLLVLGLAFSPKFTPPQKGDEAPAAVSP